MPVSIFRPLLGCSLAVLDGPETVNGVISIPLAGRPLAADLRAATGPARGAALREFIAGPENALADVAVRRVLSNVGARRTPRSEGLLVLYGPSGTGKSHLAQGIAAEWSRSRPKSSIACVAAIDFAREFEHACRRDALDRLRAQWRRASLMVVEDLDLLEKKRTVQEELARTIDVVIQRGGSVIVTIKRAPSRATSLCPALRSRLEAGLTVPLAKVPSPAAREHIIEELATMRGLEMVADARSQLAASLPGTVRELHGALLRIESSAPRRSTVVTKQLVDDFLSAGSTQSPPSLQAIAMATARHFGLKRSDMQSASRRRAVVMARGLAIYLARRLSDQSWRRLGRYFGGRDHATALHAAQLTRRRLEADSELRQALAAIEERLNVIE